MERADFVDQLAHALCLSGAAMNHAVALAARLGVPVSWIEAGLSRRVDIEQGDLVLEFRWIAEVPALCLAVPLGQVTRAAESEILALSMAANLYLADSGQPHFALCPRQDQRLLDSWRRRKRCVGDLPTCIPGSNRALSRVQPDGHLWRRPDAERPRPDVPWILGVRGADRRGSLDPPAHVGGHRRSLLWQRAAEPHLRLPAQHLSLTWAGPASTGPTCAARVRSRNGPLAPGGVIRNPAGLGVTQRSPQVVFANRDPMLTLVSTSAARTPTGSSAQLTLPGRFEQDDTAPVLAPDPRHA